MVGGGCGLGDGRAVINNRLHQTLCNFALDLKNANWGEVDPSTSVRLQQRTTRS